MSLFGVLLAQKTNSGIDKLQGTLKNVAESGYGQGTPPSLPLLIGQIVRSMLALLGVIFLVLTIYGGYLWMMARGDESQVEKAKETIKAGVIGLAIMLAAYAISSFVVLRIASVTIGSEAGGT